MRKLFGTANLEEALKKLDRLTQEEARMAVAELLRITHHVRNEVTRVGDNVVRVENIVENVGGQVTNINDNVQVIIDGARACSISCQTILTFTTRRWQASKSSGTGN